MKLFCNRYKQQTNSLEIKSRLKLNKMLLQ